MIIGFFVIQCTQNASDSIKMSCPAFQIQNGSVLIAGRAAFANWCRIRCDARFFANCIIRNVFNSACFRYSQDTILLCCKCDTTFHRACLGSVPTADGQHWVCNGCRSDPVDSAAQAPKESCPELVKVAEVAKTPEAGKVLDAVKTTVTITTPSYSSIPNFGPWIFGTRQLELRGPPLEWDAIPAPDPSVPDASNWTPEDVHNYFCMKGFGEQAALLRQHVSLIFLAHRVK